MFIVVQTGYNNSHTGWLQYVYKLYRQVTMIVIQDGCSVFIVVQTAYTLLKVVQIGFSMLTVVKTDYSVPTFLQTCYSVDSVWAFVQ